MRFVMFGAGAVGGVVGARLYEHAHDVLLVARGAHYDAIRARGLRVVAPEGVTSLPIPVVDAPHQIEFRPDDVVVLGMKSQDTEAAVRALARTAPSSVPVVCLQNGVANERTALRHFEHVYGVCVMCPAVHLEPGVVEAHATGIAGLFDIGRYPHGVDATAEQVADALGTSRCESVVRRDIMRWKYRKLVNNLSNALDALCGPEGRSGELATRARDEGIACLGAAGIDFVSEAEDRERRGDKLPWGGTAAESRPGASTWQSLARGVDVEADYLNGEIVLLGRLHDVPTPVNQGLLELVNRAAREGRPPGSFGVDEVIRIVLGSESGPPG
jgi:2-dehydropantoate 2-reductase